MPVNVSLAPPQLTCSQGRKKQTSTMIAALRLILRSIVSNYQNARATNRVMLQRNQRVVRVFQRKLLHMRADGNSASFRQKLAPIIACVIRDSTHTSFTLDPRIFK